MNELEELRTFARNFRTWWAEHFDDFDSDTNSQLLELDNAAAVALKDEDNPT